jgi:cytidine deaminase
MDANDPIIQKMRIAAEGAGERAYCPYSDFQVGAAVLTEGGAVFSGCNVENISLGLSICAERNAVFQAVSQGYRKIVAVVLVTSTSTPIMPCGACRQVINEFGGNDTEVFSFDKNGNVLNFNLGQLLPDAFGFNTPL